MVHQPRRGCGFHTRRNALGRWRSLISMMIGVGIALSIGMTILGVISAEMGLLTGDYERPASVSTSPRKAARSWHAWQVIRRAPFATPAQFRPRFARGPRLGAPLAR